MPYVNSLCEVCRYGIFKSPGGKFLKCAKDSDTQQPIDECENFELEEQTES